MAIFGRAKDKKPLREADDLGPGRQRRFEDFPQEGAPIRRRIADIPPKKDNDIERNEPWQGENPDEWPKPRWTMSGSAKPSWKKSWKQDYAELKEDFTRAKGNIEKPLKHPYGFSKNVAKKAALAGQVGYERYKAGEPERRRRRIEDQYIKSLGKPQTVVVNRSQYGYDPIRQTERQVQREVHSFLNPAPSPLNAFSSSEITSFWDVTRKPLSHDVRVSGRVSARAEARNTNRITINVNGRKVKVDPQELQQPQTRPESIWNIQGPDINIFSQRQSSMPAQQATRLSRAARKYPPRDNGGISVGHLRIL